MATITIAVERNASWLLLPASLGYSWVCTDAVSYTLRGEYCPVIKLASANTHRMR